MSRFTEDPDHTTLAAAKAWLRGRVDDGAYCPCCTQYAKIYKRKLNSSMARGLIVLVRLKDRGPIHITSIFTQRRVCPSNDGALLRHWGLIEEVVGQRGDGSSRAGYYLVTDLGRAFVAGSTRVSAYAYIYDSVLLRLCDESTVDIREALDRKFNYEELMGEEVHGMGPQVIR